MVDWDHVNVGRHVLQMQIGAQIIKASLVQNEKVLGLKDKDLILSLHGFGSRVPHQRKYVLICTYINMIVAAAHLATALISPRTAIGLPLATLINCCKISGDQKI